MEKLDEELLLEVVQTNFRIKKLYEEHLKYEMELRAFEKNPALSAWDALREKRLKKEKLKGMDIIMSTLNEYRNQMREPQVVNE